MDYQRLLFLIVLTSCLTCCQLFRTPLKIQDQCPQLYEKTFTGCIPRGNLSAGK